MLKYGSSLHPKFPLDTGVEIFFFPPKYLPKVPKPKIPKIFLCPNYAPKFSKSQIVLKSPKFILNLP